MFYFKCVMYGCDFFCSLVMVLLLREFKWVIVCGIMCKVFFVGSVFINLCVLGVVDGIRGNGFCFFRGLFLVLDFFFVDGLLFVCCDSCMFCLFIFMFLYCF